MIAGVSEPKKWAQRYCTTTEMPPTQSESMMFFMMALRSVSVRMINGSRIKSGAS